jgi:hypothetical protein
VLRCTLRTRRGESKYKGDAKHKGPRSPAIAPRPDLFNVPLPVSEGFRALGFRFQGVEFRGLGRKCTQAHTCKRAHKREHTHTCTQTHKKRSNIKQSPTWGRVGDDARRFNRRKARVDDGVRARHGCRASCAFRPYCGQPENKHCMGHTFRSHSHSVPWNGFFVSFFLRSSSIFEQVSFRSIIRHSNSASAGATM